MEEKVKVSDSSRLQAFSYTMEDHAEICALLIEELKLDDVHVVGHGMGRGSWSPGD